MVAIPQSLNEFVDFRLQYITGKERSEAQIFLDKFFRNLLVMLVVKSKSREQFTKRNKY